MGVSIPSAADSRLDTTQYSTLPYVNRASQASGRETERDMVEEVVQPRVSLKLRAGEREGPSFQNVLVFDLSCRLKDFLDSSLKDLEVRGGLITPALYWRGRAICSVVRHELAS